jgi:hypothetical protein
MVHQTNEAQSRNHDRTNKDSRAYSHYRQHGCQNATRIYLGNPCKGRLYHLITTLLKQAMKVLCHTSVGSILWKRGKDNEMQKVEVKS